MIYEGFKIHSIEHFTEAYCTNKQCKKKPELLEVSNGFLSRALFCPNCKSVYVLKLEKVPRKNVTKQFMEQCLEDVEFERRKSLLIGEIALEREMKREGQRTAKIRKMQELQEKKKLRKK